MIKLDSLSRWMPLKVGDTLVLEGDIHRRIRLHVNSPKRSSLFFVNEDGEVQFLAAPVGRDVVEFAAAGTLKISTDDEDVYVYSSETEQTCTIIPDAETFTKIAERAARNPDIEYLMHQQQINLNRRFALLERDLEQREIAAYEAGTRVANAQLAGTPAAKNDAGQSGQDGNGSASTESAGQAPSGESSNTGQNPPAGHSAPAGEPANQ